jgi:cytochrome c oxidase cbb3-type subunit I/II
MWVAGITQGSMWLSLTEDGLLRYPNFVETVITIVPFYWVRAFGGALYVGGVFLCAYNLFQTARHAEAPVDEKIEFEIEEEIKPTTKHEWLENKGLVFGSLTFVVILIGGAAEFIPAFVIESNVPAISVVTPYTPAELHGRDIYLREGCYNCHSQMIRTLPEEAMRYGHRSLAGEYVYDRPFQWGSKRTGPDLHRLGKKYPDLWHYKHMIDPRSTSPGSIMPAYSWLEKDEVNLSTLGSKISVLTMMKTPYSKEVIANPEKYYDLQTKEIAENLAKDGVTISPRSELIALIAYMQKLGTDIKKLSSEELDAFKNKN